MAGRLVDWSKLCEVAIVRLAVPGGILSMIGGIGFWWWYRWLKDGTNIVEIKGGCIPGSKNELEVALMCNFSYGKIQVVKDVRFEF